jgi:hypothetical protein
LFEVFAGGEQMGRELQPSRQERSLKREMASNGNMAVLPDLDQMTPRPFS